MLLGRWLHFEELIKSLVVTSSWTFYYMFLEGLGVKDYVDAVLVTIIWLSSHTHKKKN